MTRKFYVSQVRDGRYRLAAGPFSTHADALQAVAETRARMSERDPWSDFDAWGTCFVVRELPPR